MANLILVCPEEYVIYPGGAQAGSVRCLDELSAHAWQAISTDLPFALGDIDPVFAMSYYVAGWIVFGTPWIAAWSFSQFTTIVKNH